MQKINPLVRNSILVLISVGIFGGAYFLYQRQQKANIQFVAECESFSSRLNHKLNMVQVVKPEDFAAESLVQNKFGAKYFSIGEYFFPYPFQEKPMDKTESNRVCAYQFEHKQTPSSIQVFLIPNKIDDPNFKEMNPYEARGSVNEMLKLGFGLKNQEISCSLEDKTKTSIEMAAAGLVARLTPDYKNVRVALDAVKKGDVVILAEIDSGFKTKPAFYIEWSFPVKKGEQLAVFRFSSLDESLYLQVLATLKSGKGESIATGNEFSSCVTKLLQN